MTEQERQVVGGYVVDTKAPPSIDPPILSKKCLSAVAAADVGAKLHQFCKCGIADMPIAADLVVGNFNRDGAVVVGGVRATPTAICFVHIQPNSAVGANAAIGALIDFISNLNYTIAIMYIFSLKSLEILSYFTTSDRCLIAEFERFIIIIKTIPFFERHQQGMKRVGAIRLRFNKPSESDKIYSEGRYTTEHEEESGEAVCRYLA